jgi:hypothetical protein
MLVNDNKATPLPTSSTPAPMSKPVGNPPDYHRSSNYLLPSHFSDPQVPLRVGGQSGSGGSPLWRFVKAVVVAIGICTAVGFVAGQVFHITMHDHNGWVSQVLWDR